MIADVLTLISESYTTDEIGQKIPADPVRREIFVNGLSISRAEWFAAQNAGLDIEFAFQTPSVNYAGEQYAEYNGRKYLIYRTYERDGTTELYLSKRGGVNGNV